MLRGSSVSAAPARRRVLLAVVALVIAAGALAGCTGETREEPTASAPSPTSAPTEEPAPLLVPEGPAEANLPLFTAVTEKVWDSGDRASGRAYIDALVAAGFDRDRMQVTEDRSTVGNPAESLQFSVAWGDEECLIGQVGPSTGKPVTKVMDQLAEGRCLIGKTRPIDW